MARKKIKSENEIKRKAIPVDVSYHSKLKVLAYLKGQTLTELTEKIFDDYIKKQEKNNGLNSIMAQIEQVEKKPAKTKTDKSATTELAATVMEEETIEEVKINSEPKEEIKNDIKEENNEQEVSQIKIETEKEVVQAQEVIKDDAEVELKQDSQPVSVENDSSNTIFVSQEDDDVFQVGTIYVDEKN